MYEELAVIAILAFLFSTIAGRVEKLPVSGPLMFVVIGLVLGPLGLGWFADDVSRVQLRVLVDLTLALILFSDAANAELSVLRRQIKIPARMLLFGLPGAIVLGFGVAAVLFGHLTLYEAAILGTMLAATDAALGKAVITNESVPPHLREALNFESGLNDGLCVPILLVFIALALGHAESGLAMRLLVEELGIGMAVGVAVAGAGAWLLQYRTRKGWVSKVWVQVSAPALAIACFAIADSLEGSGYIAAFTGGITFGLLAKGDTHKLVMPGEGIAEAMAMLTWLIFGTAVIGQVAQELTWQMIVYAVLSLTLIRMVPVFLSLTGSGESSVSKLFLGWFGPRGLASIVFAIIVVDVGLPGSRFIAMVVTCTVGMSLLAHGVSATPMARWIGSKEAPSAG